MGYYEEGGDLTIHCNLDELEIIMLSEVTHKKKDKYRMTSLLYCI